MCVAAEVFEKKLTKALEKNRLTWYNVKMMDIFTLGGLEAMRKFEELLVTRGLYDSIGITVNDLEEIEAFLSENEYSDSHIDCYCIECGEKRTFRYFDSKVYEKTPFMAIPITENVFEGVSVKKGKVFKSYQNRRYSLTYSCTRNDKHQILFDLIVGVDKVVKIGQFPPLADLEISDIEKYKTLLGKQYTEFKKAIGLFSHGIGIGSFVYLRRIIENLIFNKYNKNADTLGLSREDFLKLHFSEKIDTLKDYLPVILVENKGIYSIVSKGIHELSEEDCLNLFPKIKLGIELIFDDLLAEKEREQKEKKFRQAISQTLGELNQ